MKRRNQPQKAARAARRNIRRQRRRGGVASIMLGPNDGAVVFRASGRLQFNDSRAEPNPGTGAFWLHVLRWLFAGNEDAAERRQILVDDFMLDMQEHAAAVRRAAIEAEAKDRVEAYIAAMEGEVTDENREVLMVELVPKYVAEIEAEIEAKKQKVVEEVVEKVHDNKADPLDESTANGGENPPEPIEATSGQSDPVLPFRPKEPAGPGCAVCGKWICECRG